MPKKGRGGGGEIEIKGGGRVRDELDMVAKRGRQRTTETVLGPLGGRFGASFGPLGGLLGRLGGLLGASWGLFGASWGLLGASWGGRLDFSVRGPSLGPFLGPS